MEFWRGLLVGVMVLMAIVGGGEAQLRQNFYARRWPNVERIDREAGREEQDKADVRHCLCDVEALLPRLLC